MNTELRVIKAQTEDEIWHQVRPDFEGEELLEYNVLLETPTSLVELFAFSGCTSAANLKWANSCW